MLRDGCPSYAALPRRGLNHLRSTKSSPSAHQINDQNHQPHNQEQVYEGSADMQTETQNPQNQENNKTCPQHDDLLFGSGSNQFQEVGQAVWFGGDVAS